MVCNKKTGGRGFNDFVEPLWSMVRRYVAGLLVGRQQSVRPELSSEVVRLSKIEAVRI